VRQQLADGQGASDLVRVAIQGNLQFPTPILAYQPGLPYLPDPPTF
jgi:hypothetical protein